MAALLQSLAGQWSALRRHKGVGAALVVLGLLVLWQGARTGAVAQAVAYLVAMWLASVATDTVLILFPPRTVGQPVVVKRPTREAILVLLAAVLGLTTVVVRFFLVPDLSAAAPGVRMLLAVALALFLFPVALALVFLGMGYRWRDFGLRPRGLIVVVVVVPIIAGAVLLVVPDHLQWAAALKQFGPGGLLFTGLIMAALPEEFSRWMAQTRFSAALGNNAWGWFLPSISWSLMHARPSGWWDEALGSASAMPIGLLWGYLSYRTRSIVPAVIAHGTNLWGLQAFR